MSRRTFTIQCPTVSKGRHFTLGSMCIPSVVARFLFTAMEQCAKNNRRRCDLEIKESVNRVDGRCCRKTMSKAGWLTLNVALLWILIAGFGRQKQSWRQWLIISIRWLPKSKVKGLHQKHWKKKNKVGWTSRMSRAAQWLPLHWAAHQFKEQKCEHFIFLYC